MALFEKKHDDDISLDDAWNAMKALSKHGKALQRIETVIRFAKEHTQELSALAQEQQKVGKEREDLATMLATIRNTHNSTMTTEKQKHDLEITRLSTAVDTAKTQTNKRCTDLTNEISVLEGQKVTAASQVTAINVQVTHAGVVAAKQENERVKAHQLTKAVRERELTALANRIEGLKKEFLDLAGRFKL